MPERLLRNPISGSKSVERLWSMLRWPRTTPTREGWYYLLVMAFVISGGLLRDINLLLVVAGMMAGPMFYNWRHAVVSLRGASIDRTSTLSVSAGQAVEVDLTLENHGRRKTCSAVLVEETLRGEAGPGRGATPGGAVLFGHVAPLNKRHGAYSLRIPQRGRYRTRTLRASTRFPFGLMRRTRFIRRDTQITVYPAIGRLLRAWHDLLAQSALGSRPRNRLGQQEGDFLGLRDWQPGDARRWIHWRTSARRGNLVVRQFEKQDDEDLTLLVDLHSTRKANAETRAELEQAIRFAATVTVHWSRKSGCRFRLLVGGRNFVDISATTTKEATSQALAELAVAMPTTSDHLPRMLAQGLDARAGGGTIVVVSQRQNQLANAQLLQQLDGNASVARNLAHCHWLCSAEAGLAPFYEETRENRDG